MFHEEYPTLAVKREVMPAIEILIEFDMVNFSLFSKDTHFPWRSIYSLHCKVVIFYYQMNQSEMITTFHCKINIHPRSVPNCPVQKLKCLTFLTVKVSCLDNNIIVRFFVKLGKSSFYVSYYSTQVTKVVTTNCHNKTSLQIVITACYNKSQQNKQQFWYFYLFSLW